MDCFCWFIFFSCRYGSTKCGLRQLQASLLKESKRSNVAVHTASPGMVLTDLLLRYIRCVPITYNYLRIHFYRCVKFTIWLFSTCFLKYKKKRKKNLDHFVLVEMFLYCSTVLLKADKLTLCSGSTIQNKQMFNIICELPETVARTLVPRMRVVKGNGKAINYLTPPRILLALVTAWLRRGRWFDEQVILIHIKS